MKKQFLKNELCTLSIWNVCIAVSATLTTALVSLGNFPYQNGITVCNCIVMFLLSFYLLTKKKNFRKTVASRIYFWKQAGFRFGFVLSLHYYERTGSLFFLL